MAVFRELDLSAIHRADETYQISRAGTDLSALEISIKSQGIQVPLVVRERENNPGVILVSGFRRFDAAQSLGLETMPCQVLSHEDKKRCARISVLENAFQRELGPGELVRAVLVLEQHLSNKEIADSSPALFNTRFNPRYMKSLAEIGRLPAPALDLLDEGRLSLKAAQAVAGLPNEAGEPLLKLFSGIRVSTGKQMEIIAWIKEICARDQISMTDLLDTETVSQAMTPDGDHQDLAAAGNRLRAVLYRLRFPALDAARQDAANRVRELKLPKEIRIHLPENFESMTYGITLEFTGTDDFKQTLATLSDLADHPSFTRLLNRS